MIPSDQNSPTHEKEELNACKPIAAKACLYRNPKQDYQSSYFRVIVWQQFACLSNICSESILFRRKKILMKSSCARVLIHILEDLVETNDIPSFPAAKRSRETEDGWSGGHWSHQGRGRREERPPIQDSPESFISFDTFLCLNIC